MGESLPLRGKLFLLRVAKKEGAKLTLEGGSPVSGSCTKGRAHALVESEERRKGKGGGQEKGPEKEMGMADQSGKIVLEKKKKTGNCISGGN